MGRKGGCIVPRSSDRFELKRSFLVRHVVFLRIDILSYGNRNKTCDDSQRGGIRLRGFSISRTSHQEKEREFARRLPFSQTWILRGRVSKESKYVRGEGVTDKCPRAFNPWHRGWKENNEGESRVFLPSFAYSARASFAHTRTLSHTHTHTMCMCDTLNWNRGTLNVSRALT